MGSLQAIVWRTRRVSLRYRNGYRFGTGETLEKRNNLRKHKWTSCISKYCKISLLVVHHINIAFHTLEPLSRQKSASHKDSCINTFCGSSTELGRSPGARTSAWLKGCWLGLLTWEVQILQRHGVGCECPPHKNHKCYFTNHLKPFLGECIANHPKIHIDSSQTFSIIESTFQSAAWILSISSSSHEFLTPSRRHWQEWPQCPKPGKTWRKIKES